MVAFGPQHGESEEVLDWCQNLVDSIRDGGVWGIPRSGLVFQFNQQEQTMTLIEGDRNHWDFSKTREVFSQIGWRVL